MIVIQNDFLNKLINRLKKCSVREYIIYSLDKWIKYIDDLSLMDEFITDYISNKCNKEDIKRFVNTFGILNLQYSEDRILKRCIIGFDFDLSIRIQKDYTFKEYFLAYEKYLIENTINNSLKLKLILSVISRKVNTIPKLATLDTIENDWEKVSYNIYYSGALSESLAINIRQDLNNDLAVLSDKRNNDLESLIENEIMDMINLLSKGLFSLIINDNYPNTLESIISKEEHIRQIEDRILKDETPVKYQGILYKSIRLDNSYVIIDENLMAVENPDLAETIYCKINLSKSMLE